MGCHGWSQWLRHGGAQSWYSVIVGARFRFWWGLAGSQLDVGCIGAEHSLDSIVELVHVAEHDRSQWASVILEIRAQESGLGGEWALL